MAGDRSVRLAPFRGTGPGPAPTLTTVTDVHGASAAQAELLDQLYAPAPPPPRRKRWPYALVVLALVAGGLSAALVLREEKGPQGPPHPAAWDPEVEKYVDFVEDERGLKFEHPVYVDFLPDEEFEDAVTADRDDLSDDDLEEIEQATGLLRALGLVEGDVDLFDQSNDLMGKGVIGFYAYEDERLRLRGTELTPAVESTLVHELTHALQDQHFDLGARLEELAKADDIDSSATQSGFDALVEGDARRIETAWRDSLSAKGRKALDKEQSAAVEGFESDAKDVPEVLKTMFAAPYDLGEALLATAVQQGGDRAVDDLFRSPPTTEEQQLDPWTLVADHQGYLTVPEPELKDGEKSFDDGAFGALGWLMMLSQRLPAEQALTAVDGWGGDSYAAFERDGVSCVSIVYRGDTPADFAEMKTALKAWVAKLPKAPASVSAADDLTLVFESCDPGKSAAKVASGKSMDAVTLALTRTYLSVALVKGGVPVPTGRCGADRLVREFTPAQLNDPKIDQQRIAQVIAPCREQV